MARRRTMTSYSGNPDVNGDGFLTPLETAAYNEPAQTLELRPMGGSYGMSPMQPMGGMQDQMQAMQVARMNAMQQATRANTTNGFMPVPTRSGWVNLMRYHPEADWAPLHYAWSTGTYAFRRPRRALELFLMGAGVVLGLPLLIGFLWNANFSIGYKGPGHIDGAPGLESYRQVVTVEKN